MKSIDDILNKNPQFIDLRFTDLRGRWMHTSRTIEGFSQSLVENGSPIGGAAITGFQRANESDLLLKPDMSTWYEDHLSEIPTVAIISELVDPILKDSYDKDTRSVLRRAISYLKENDIADEILIGPELEFYLFNAIEYRTSAAECFVRIDEYDGLQSNFVKGSGHRISYPSLHLACSPSDINYNFRNLVANELRKHQIIPIHHHHESGPSQHEIGIKAMDAMAAADGIQKQKFIIQNMAEKFNKTATFMPKPIAYAPGSGLHLNISLWKKNKPLFLGKQQNLLSKQGSFFVGGILKHIRALNAFLNPSVSSYKRLRSAFSLMSAPSYGFRNRSALIRVPVYQNPSECRIEVRFGDSSGNPYTGIAALILAGLDGIENKIDPGEFDMKNNYVENGVFDARKIDPTTVCGSLEEAVVALDKDKDFLRKGDAFSESLIEAHTVELNRQIRVMDTLPHPNEFSMYYSG